MHIARKDLNYDQYVGAAALEEIGRKRWRKRVERTVDAVRELVNFDVLYIGAGIHGAEYMTGEKTDEAKLAAFLKKEGATPKWWMSRLA